MRNAACACVALFDRRKGYGEHILDRRRTYVDIMERVLGSDILSTRPRQRSRFTRAFNIAGTPVGTAVAAVEVLILENIRDKR